MIVIACVSQHKLLQQLRSGDAQTVNTFYYKLWHKVFQTLAAKYQAYQLQLLEDCFSEAFLIFLQKIQDSDFRAQNLEGYAYKIVHFTFRDRLKRKRWQMATAPAELPEPALENATSFYTVDELFADQEEDRLVHWFHGLSGRDQQILNLQLQNFKLHEIAEKLDLSHGSVRNIRSRLIMKAKAAVPTSTPNHPNQDGGRADPAE